MVFREKHARSNEFTLDTCPEHITVKPRRFTRNLKYLLQKNYRVWISTNILKIQIEMEPKLLAVSLGKIN